MRICIVSNGLIGPVRNGGISTHYLGLTETLLDAGHDVTYLYLGGMWTESDPVDQWVRRYEERGIRVVPLPEPRLRINNPHDIRISYQTYEWLRERDEFDVIHFHEWHGHGYYSLLAKHQGLAFGGTTLCVGTHSPTSWNKEGNLEFMDQVTTLEIDYLERQSVRLADVVISPSQYMLDWIGSRGWSLPPTCRVIPNVLPASALRGREAGPSARSSGAGESRIEELVFFGRLEGRKGLGLFCDALDRLAHSELRPRLVTFLGKDGTIAGRYSLDYIQQRSGNWAFPHRLITTYGNVEALDYLRQPGRVAVMPSLMENAPMALHECLLMGIPVLASSVGGIPEMVRADDRDRTLFPLRADPLARRLEDVLRKGLSPAQPAFDEAANRKAWLDWHDEQPRRCDRQTSCSVPSPPPLPLVSVCVPHFNRPHHLRQAIESLHAQDYPHLEVIVVDDGSTLPEAIGYLDTLAPEFAARGWRILRQENRYPGAARNNAARHARGEYLLFMDDDNIAKPHEISRFIEVANRTGADILTCFAEMIRADDPAQGEYHLDFLYLYLGDALAVGAFYNCFGDTNALVRRDTFMAIGGFTEDYGYNHEDKELYGRAILAGYRLQVVPEMLYSYRVSDTGLNYSTCRYLNAMRGLRPYLAILPDPFRQVLVYAHAQFLKSLSPPPQPPPPAIEPPQPPAPVDLPLRYRVVDRLNLMVKRLGPIHRVAKASLIFLIAIARWTKQWSIPLGAIAEDPQHGPRPSASGRPNRLKGPHARSREEAPRESERPG